MTVEAVIRRLGVGTFLELGRVSNLPTVWSNVLAGAALAGGELTASTLALPLLGCTLMYVAGMFLNDAFDAEHDRRERSTRPIPSGRLTAVEVFIAGTALLFAGWFVLAAQVAFVGGGRRLLLSGAALAAVIVLYDAWHRHNPVSPVLMGAARALVYLVAGYATVDSLDSTLWEAAAVLLAYVAGLTYAAKQETLARVQNLWPLLLLALPFAWALPGSIERLGALVLWIGFAVWVVIAVRMFSEPGQVGRGVGQLIAGISLLDAVLIAAYGPVALAWVAVAAFGATLLLHRWVAGT